MKAVQTMTLDTQYSQTGDQKYTGVHVQNVGFDQTTIKEYVSQYQIQIGETDRSGYQGVYQEGVYQQDVYQEGDQLKDQEELKDD